MKNSAASKYTQTPFWWRQLGEIFGAPWYDKFGSEPSDQWLDALKSMPQAQIRTALGRVRSTAPPYSGWMPSLPEFLAYTRNAAAFPIQEENLWHGSESLRQVNLMFYRWMQHEIFRNGRAKFTERFLSGAIGKPRCIPNAELEERRQACIELAAAHEELLAAKDPEATHDRLVDSFIAAMDRIKPLPADHPSNDRPYRSPAGDKLR